MFADVNWRSENIPSGSIGCGLARSASTNRTSASTPTAPATHGSADEPVPGAAISAYVVPPSPSAARNAPRKSMLWLALGSRLSGTRRDASTTNAPIGTLIRNTARQLTASTR